MTDTARNQERIPLTAAGRLQLQGEIERIESQAAELRELIADAHEDRSADEDERAAAYALLDDLGRAEARLNALHSILDRAVDATPAESDTVGVGTVVRVKDEDGEESTYTLVTAAEAAPAGGRISVDSPLGRALTGHRLGDEVTVEAPAGSWGLRILAIGEEVTRLAA